MIKTYSEKDKPSHIKVFFSVDLDGNIRNVQIGDSAIPVEQGFQFYVDDYIADQIHKCELYLDGFTPRLRVKEGETLFVPEKNDEYYKQKEIEELEKKLKELKGDAE